MELFTIHSWLLELHKYIPNLIPKNKDEAIGYYYFLKLLDSIYSGKLNLVDDSSDNISVYLCDKMIMDDYGGNGKYFQQYLTRFFYRGDYSFTWNSKECRCFTLHQYYQDLLNKAYCLEWETSSYRVVKKPINKSLYAFKNLYSINFYGSKHKIEFNDVYSAFMKSFISSIDKNPALSTPEKKDKFLEVTKKNIENGFVFFNSVNDLRNFTSYSNLECRESVKKPFITLVSAPYNEANSDRNEKSARDLSTFEYIEDSMQLNENVLKQEIRKYEKELCLKPMFRVKHSILKKILSAYENKKPLVYRAKHGLRLMNINEGLSVNLQGINKELRQLLFTSYHDYDIQTSAPTILYQLYQHNCSVKAKELSYLEAYIKDKNKFRNSLSGLIEKYTSTKERPKSIKLAKQIFTAILFGARVFSSKSSLQLPNDLKSHMKKNELINGLMNDITTLYRDMGSYYKKHRIKIGHNAFTVTNPFGRPFQVQGKWNIRVVLSNIYQSIERYILDTVIKKYDKSIVLKIHDGFISSTKLDIKELETYIKSSTSFNIKYEYSPIPPSSP